VALDLDQQLSKLDELLGLLDASALRSAQETLEFHIAELSERLETTRQALVHAQAQRRRLARARLLLEESANEPNGNGDPALHPVPVHAVPVSPKQPATTTAPFVADRRATKERRANGERRQSEDRRAEQHAPPAV
jgi:hypothetical protein